MNVEVIKNQLKQLRLAAACKEIDEVLATHKKAVSLSWVADLLERELNARKENSLRSRIKQAGFPEITALEGFDWTFNPDIKEDKIRELATLDFVEKNEIALFLGSPGVGKTHLALAIGITAAQKGHRVFWTSSKRLAARITLAKHRGVLDSLFKKMLSSRLWIIDDWGVITMNREVSEEVFDLLDRRKHSTAMILTSNRDVAEWGQVFPEPVLANAAIDRMFDRAHILTFTGQSYRLKGRIKTREIDTQLNNT
jgi:DNA replication protein DnaC